MTDSRLEIVLMAKNQTEAAFRGVVDGLKGVTSTAGLVKGALAGLVAGVSFAGLVQGLNTLKAAGSDAEETFSKVQTLFGADKARELREWGEAADYAMGLSRTAALDAVGSMGNMFLQLGANIEESARLSQSMVQLSADLASFHNAAGGSAAVLETMQSAFRGEYDALQRYIPTIKAASVEQEALRRSGKASKDELTELDKALAAVAIITRDAGAATGDFARTSNSAANQQRIFDAQLANVKEKLGEAVLPAFTEAIRHTNEWIKENDKLLKQDLPKLFGDIAESLANMIEPAARVAEYIARIASVSPQFKEFHDMMERAGEYARHGLLDPSQLAGLDTQQALDRTREWVELLDKTVRITADGQIRYLIGEHTAGRKAAIAADKERMQGLYLTDGTAGQKPLVPLPMVPQMPTPPQIGAAGSVHDWVMLVQPDSEAEQAYRNLDKMLEDRNALFGTKNESLIQLSDRTAWVMQENFSSLFLDVWRGDLEDFEDYFKRFFESLQQIAADYLAQMATEWIFGDSSTGKSSGFLKFLQGITGSGSSSGAAADTSGWFNYDFTMGSVFAKGGAFGRSGVKYFAAGDIITGPTAFRYNGGIGVMGEAGDEAIMPLKRTADGRLGVEASGGVNLTVAPVYNVYSVDDRSVADFFKRNRGKLASELVDEMKHRPELTRFFKA
ncbi:phage tail tape measure protein [Desulfatitalea tepidiphila]|uniref:phage tail tape measure protein n=1 Tax=Desulfatitalea tepidiphila TaxID=1185843 RepID=UPI0006B42269|nr:phage tail tape measure protein [Desulfatitalea tepidiphila]